MMDRPNCKHTPFLARSIARSETAARIPEGYYYCDEAMLNVSNASDRMPAHRDPRLPMAIDTLRTDVRRETTDDS